MTDTWQIIDRFRSLWAATAFQDAIKRGDTYDDAIAARDVAIERHREWCQEMGHE